MRLMWPSERMHERVFPKASSRRHFHLPLVPSSRLFAEALDRAKDVVLVSTPDSVTPLHTPSLRLDFNFHRSENARRRHIPVVALAAEPPRFEVTGAKDALSEFSVSGC